MRFRNFTCHMIQSKIVVLYISLLSSSAHLLLLPDWTRSKTSRPTGIGLLFPRATRSNVFNALSVRPESKSNETDSGSH